MDYKRVRCGSALLGHCCRTHHALRIPALPSIDACACDAVRPCRAQAAIRQHEVVAYKNIWGHCVRHIITQ